MSEDVVLAAAQRQMGELNLHHGNKPHPPTNGTKTTPKPPLPPTTPTLPSSNDCAKSITSEGSTGSASATGKKLPMNRITVGHAPSPQISKATSKIGSLGNTSYRPGGGKVKIESKKLEWNAKSRIGSLDNVGHKAGGGGVKIQSQKIKVAESAKSRIGSLANVGHKAGGGEVRIFDDKEYLKGRGQGGGGEGGQRGRSSGGGGQGGVVEGRKTSRSSSLSSGRQ